MWLDELPGRDQIALDALTPAQRRALQQNQQVEEERSAPRFGGIPLKGQPAGAFQSPMAYAYMPVPQIAAQQNAYLNNLANDMGDEVEQTIQNENNSRVAQSREMRRMAHEQELERMRQETERMKIDAMIRRLDNTVRFPGGAIRLG